VTAVDIVRRSYEPAHDGHGALDRGFKLGHVTGHSIRMTVIDWPKIGEGDETELRDGMVFSMHPHAISQDGQACLSMRAGVPLAELSMRIFDGTEGRP
jgi:Xaa-Pro dipeptidase